MSNAAMSRRALAVFDEILDLPENQREAWIETQCAGDATLEREVRALVAGAAMTSGILDAPQGLAAAPDMLDAVRAAFADGYEIVREIGRGGMATVFLAHERKHDRDVVIKVLDPSVAYIFGAERFLREVRIAATHAHPHIVPLLDSGDAGGFLYYVMPWLGGETLRARLQRGSPSVTEGVGVLRDICGALEFAHGLGVVHRDLKPENVLLTTGHAYLLDFGIAKLLDDSSAAMNITMPGIAVGTLRYMAPEQGLAAADVDARADIYAWGLMGLEMFSATPQPRELSELLEACAATIPANRPVSMSVVAQRLDTLTRVSRATSAPRRRSRLLAGGAVLIAVAAVVIAMARRGDTTTGLAEPIAATILRNETRDSALSVVGRYAGDWVTDGMQRMGGVRVVPWSEALLASEHATTTGAPLVATVREQAHAGTVVTGSFYLMHDSLHIQAQLSDARTGRIVATLAPIVVAANRPEDGVSQLRDRVMGAIATARDERVAALPGLTRSPPSFSAYQSFDRGMDHFLAQRYDDALVAFRDAVARDPSFTAALLLGARAAWNSEDFAVAESLVTRARTQQRDDGTYNDASLRYIEALLHGDGVRARAAIERAAAIAPNSRAGYDYAQSLLDAGYAKRAHEQLAQMDPDRGEMRGWSSFWTQRAHAAHLLNDPKGAIAAAREMKRRHPERRVALVLEARALASADDTRSLDSALVAWDSLPTSVYWSQGAAMTTAGEELMRRGRDSVGRRYAERAVAWFANRLVVAPNDRAHRYWMGATLYSLGRYEEARPYFEALSREYPDRLIYRGLAALTNARRGDTLAANRWLGTVASRDTGEFLAYRARIAAVLGDVEGSIALLTTAVDRGIDGYPWLRGSSFRDFTAVARDPRGHALLTGR